MALDIDFFTAFEQTILLKFKFLAVISEMAKKLINFNLSPAALRAVTLGRV